MTSDPQAGRVKPISDNNFVDEYPTAFVDYFSMPSDHGRLAETVSCQIFYIVAHYLAGLAAGNLTLRDFSSHSGIMNKPATIVAACLDHPANGRAYIHVAHGASLYRIRSSLYKVESQTRGVQTINDLFARVADSRVLAPRSLKGASHC